ncbi:MAG TPA: cytochrome c [Verrucomicrobiae bacterium]|jgi:cytochrome c5
MQSKSLLSLASGLLLLAVVGCSTPAAKNAGGTATAAQPDGKKTAALASHSGATLWAQACAHCHNIRSPDSYSNTQWDVILLHMRVRANLTPEEHRQILAFLKSAH